MKVTCLVKVIGNKHQWLKQGRTMLLLYQLIAFRFEGITSAGPVGSISKWHFEKFRSLFLWQRCYRCVGEMVQAQQVKKIDSNVQNLLRMNAKIYSTQKTIGY
jgi:hypothetical protein